MSSQEHAKVEPEFFRELARMMRERGVSVSDRNTGHPSPEELANAETILSEASLPSAGASVKLKPDSLSSIESRFPCNLDQLKQYLVGRGGELLGHAATQPIATVAQIMGDRESIYYAYALRRIIAIDTRRFFASGLDQERVPSIECPRGSLIAFRVNNTTGQARLDVIDPGAARNVKRLIESNATGEAPFCPDHLLETDPSLAPIRDVREGRAQIDSMRSLRAVLKRYGVTNEMAAEYIAASAQHVLYQTRGRAHYIRFKTVTPKATLRVLDGSPRRGDEVRVDFIKCFCQALKSHMIINLRESSELVSREEYKRRFPNVRISDSFLRMSLKKREAVDKDKQAKFAARALRIEKRSIFADQHTQRAAIVEETGPMICRAFTNGILIESVAQRFNELGAVNLNGSTYWSVHDVRNVYKRWLAAHPEFNEQGVTSAYKGYGVSAPLKNDPATQPRSEKVVATVVKADLQTVMAQLVQNRLCNYIPTGSIAFQGISQTPGGNGKPKKFGVYRLTRDLAFETMTNQAGIVYQHLLTKNSLVLTCRNMGQLEINVIPSDHGESFLSKLFSKPPKSQV